MSKIILASGSPRHKELLEQIGIEFDIIKKGGAWYSYEETKIGQGIENTITMLKDNLELYEEIRNKVINRLKNPNNAKEVPQQS